MFEAHHNNEKMSFYNKVQQILKGRIVKRVGPFAALMFGVWVVTKELATTRYEFSKQSALSPDEAAQYGIQMKKPGEVTIETEYEKIKNLDIDNWENKRVPRPWEEEDQATQ